MKQVSLEVFAYRLNKLRTERNLSTRALGEAVGTSNATISRYETGQRDPDLLIVNKLANYFGVSLEYLCGEDFNNDLDTLVSTFNKLSEQSQCEAVKYVNYPYERERE